MKKPTITITLILLLLLFSQSLLFAKDEPTIDSESAIILDAQTGQVLYQKNLHQKLYPASITKLLTALIALETLNPQDTITFSDHAINSLAYGSSRIGMKVGETITVEDALHGLLLMSANEVANGIAEKVSGSISDFVDLMNERALELGALDSHFENPHGLTDSNHLTTVYDMALITQEIIKNDYFLEIMSHTMYQIPPTNKEDDIRDLAQQHKMVNDKNDMRIYREDVIAGKVGYTKESGHTLVTVATQGNRTLIVVIMKTDASHEYTDTASLLDYGFAHFNSKQLDLSKLQTSVDIRENNGNISYILLSHTASQDILLPTDYSQDSLEYLYNIDSNLTTSSPAIGDLGGTCDIVINGAVTLSLPLYIETIDHKLMETDNKLIGTDNEISEGSTTVLATEVNPPLKEKKSFFPLVLILLTFTTVTGICLPNTSNK